jgi:copper homeostasis protein
MFSGNLIHPTQDAELMELEVCIDSVESAIAAQRGGAQRVELCCDLLEGGITPSAGLIATVRARIDIGLFLMIRPRGGDFCYSDLEFELMQQEIVFAQRLGADGVVLGLLDEDGCVDVTRTRQLVELAAPLEVTFHRAIDMTPSLSIALEDVIATGATRILTSGSAPNAKAGIREIARMVDEAQGRIAIMPGGGITPHNVATIAQETGASEFHSSARLAYPSPMRFRKQNMAMGDFSDREYQRYGASESSVRALVEALASAPARTVGAPAD